MISSATARRPVSAAGPAHSADRRAGHAAALAPVRPASAANQIPGRRPAGALSPA
jgi:hypothetical protein